MPNYRAKLVTQSLEFLDDAAESGTYVTKHKINTGTADKFKFEKASAAVADIECGGIDASTGTFSSTLAVTGNADLNAQLDVEGAANFQAAGTFGGDLTVNANSDLNGTLDVSSTGTFGGILTVNANSDLNGELDVEGAANFQAAGTFGGDLTVNANSDLNGTLDVSSTGTFGGILTVNANSDLNGELDVQGAANFQAAGTFGGAVAMNAGGSVASGQVLTIADVPTANTHAANKLYVDSVAQGLDAKDACQVGTTANIADLTSAPAAIDGITLADDMRVLVKDQTDASENGIYIFNGAGSAMTRAVDFDANGEVKGAYSLVQEGTVNGGNGFVVTSPNGDDSVTVGGTDIVWAQFSGAGQIVAGDGMSKTGNTLDVNVDDSSLEINADSLRIKASGVTNAMLAGSIANDKLSNSTISGKALGTDLASLAVDSNSGLSMTSYNGSGAGVSDLKMDINSLTEVAAVLVDADEMAFADASASAATKKVTVSNIKDTVYGSVSGDAVIAAGGALTIQAEAVHGSMLNGDVVDDSSLQLDSNQLKIKALGVTNAMLAGSIENAKLSNSTISNIALGGTLGALSVGGSSGLAMTGYDGSAAVSDLAINIDGSSAENANSLELTANGIRIKPDADIEVQSMTVSSDERLKDNISTIEDGLVTINSIRPVTWDWKSNGEKASGVVAQQLQKKLPYLVNENQLKLSVNYNGLSGHIISAIQQLSAKVDELSGFAHP